MSSTLLPLLAAIGMLAAFGLLLGRAPAAAEPPVESPGRRGPSARRITLALIPVAWLTWPSMGLAPEWLGIDLSWRLGLTWASEHGLVHGRDILYTYGPLHFLATRLPPAGAGWTLVVADLMLWLGTLLVLAAVMRSRPRPWLLAALLALVWLAGGPYFYGHDLPFSALWLCWALVALALHDSRASYAVGAILLAAVLLLVKLNTGLFALALALPLLVMAAWWHGVSVRAGALRAVALVVAAGTATLALAWGLDVALFDYIRLGLEQVLGYVDTMAQPIGQSGMLGWLAAGTVVVAMTGMTVLRGGIRDIDLRDASVAALSCAGVGLAFLQGFTRPDPGHIGVFLRSAPLFLWLGAALGGVRYARGFTLALVCTLPMVALHEARLRPAGALHQFGAPLRYVSGLPALIRGEPDTRMWPTLPASLLAALDGQRVDVFPHDTALLRERPAMWQPRPAFQDIVVVSGAMDRLNEAFYLRASRPTRVLTRVDACDAAAGCWQAESRTRLALVEQYAPAHVGTDHMLLAPRATPLARQVSPRGPAVVGLGQPIVVPVVDHTAWLLRAVLRHSPAGRLTRLLSQPPQVTLDVVRTDGQRIRSVASVSRLAGGVLVGPLPMTRAERLAFTQGAISLLPASSAVVIDSPNAWGFAADVRIELEAHTLTLPAADTVTASVTLADLGQGPWGSGVWPVAPPAAALPEPGCPSGVVDRVWQEGDGQWWAEGWAVVADAPADGVMAWDDDTTIGRSLTMGERADVLMALDHGRGLLSGWRMMLSAPPSSATVFTAVDGRAGEQHRLCRS